MMSISESIQEVCKPLSMLFTADFWKFIFQHYMRVDGQRHVVSLTYATLFAIVPLLTVTLAVISQFPLLKDAGPFIQDFIFKHFLPSSGLIVQSKIMDFSRHAGGLTAIGVFMLLVTAFAMMRSIEKSFNHIWMINNGRSGVIRFLQYWAIISLGPVLVGIGFILSSYLVSLNFMSLLVSDFYFPVVRVFSFVITVMAFSLLYAIVPNRKVPFFAYFTSALLAAFLFEIAKYGFELFVRNFNSYQLIYGAFAAIPVFLIWVYVSWALVISGVVLSHALTVYRPVAAVDGVRFLDALDILGLLSVRHQKGCLVSESDINALLSGRSFEYAEQLKQELMASGMVKECVDGDYVLAKATSAITLSDVFKLFPFSAAVLKEALADYSVSDSVRKLLHDFSVAEERILSPSLEDIFQNQQGAN